MRKRLPTRSVVVLNRVVSDVAVRCRPRQARLQVACGSHKARDLRRCFEECYGRAGCPHALAANIYCGNSNGVRLAVGESGDLQ